MNQVSGRILDITTIGALPSLPQIGRVAWERRAGGGYHCQPGAWSFPQATVQLTLAGTGALWPDGHGAARPVTRGRALAYVSREHRTLTYGLADGATPWEFLYFNLRGSAAEAMLCDLARLHGHVLTLDPAAPVVRDCLALLPKSGYVHRAWSLTDSTTLAQRLLLALSGAPAVGAEQAPLPDDQLVARAIHHLDQRLGDAWTIASLAETVGVSREHLTRVFTARTGTTPAAWLRHRRIATAARRLRGGEPVAAIARSCGFSDPAHFARIFRRHTGTTPGRFRAGGGVPGW